MLTSSTASPRTTFAIKITEVDPEEALDAAWIPANQASKWIAACPGGICRACNEAYDVIKRAAVKGGRADVHLAGLAGLMRDTLEQRILPSNLVRDLAV